MFHFIVYTQITNPVIRFVRVIDGVVWDETNQVASPAPAWTDSAIVLSKSAAIGGVPVRIPTLLPAGDRDALFYDSASPVETDPLDFGKRLQWTGTGLIGLPIEL